ncbi:MAG TPA: conjugative transposon protein TraK [Niabella sp.]|nr:conjugative transposon protein TraK [Niabella sp.]
MKNIDTAFKQVRLFAFLVIAGCLILSVFIIWRTTKVLTVNSGKVYVLVNGKLVEAIAEKRNLPVELRAHIRTFHTLFFTLSPDEKAIQQQVTKAFYLADGSARRIYKNMKEAGFYNNLISGNISQTIEIETIDVDMAKAPYKFRCVARQYITRPTSILVRGIVTEGFIRTGLVQSDNNTYGFLIERWEIVENNDIKVSER